MSEQIKLYRLRRKIKDGATQRLDKSYLETPLCDEHAVDAERTNMLVELGVSTQPCQICKFLKCFQRGTSNA